MRGSSLKYLAKEGVRNVWLNRLMAVASIGVLTACLLLVGIAILLSENVNNMVLFVEQQNDIVIFIKDDATDEQVAELEAAIDSQKNIIQKTYISQAEALEEMTERIDAAAELFESLEEDTLPASFRIRIDNMAYLEDIILYIDQYDAVEEIYAPNNVAETMVSLKHTINTFSILMISTLILVSMIIISNTIRATVFARRTEVGIMRHVGATNSFIRIPFLIEGIILGLISAIIAYFVIRFAYNNVIGVLFENASPFLQSLEESIVPFQTISGRLFGYFAAAGVALGALGTLISLRSHLKV